MSRDAYRDAGVDIDAGAEAVRRLRPHAERTHRPEVIAGVGGFASLFALGGRWRDPVLVAGADGVGTKLLVARRAGRHRGVGVDLVAMCVNDVITTGAEPLFFLDYLATGRLDPAEVEEVVAGIADGCVEAGCALVGGETAEMPGMYAPGHYDLAGFCVGAVERDAVLDGRGVRAGDAVVGLPSSGLHSNGFSLVRRLVDDLDWSEDPGGLGRPLVDELTEPTRIYVRAVAALRAAAEPRALVHVTGGGLVDNPPRVLPDGLGVVLWTGAWEEPQIFGLLRRLGGLGEAEMRRTFNLGLGMLAIVPADRAEAAAAAAGGRVVGEVVRGAGVRFEEGTP